MKPRILIVEDEPAIADNLVYALETEGFACAWRATAGEGLVAVEAMAADPGAGDGPFALAILDVGLPDMGGFDLCREIRRRCDLPILFLTARSGEIDRVVGLELGADDYVVKPFSPREVAARVRAILRRSRPAGAPGGTAAPAPAGDPPGGVAAAIRPAGDPAAHAFPFVHDPDRMRIAYSGVVLDLSRYEYRLLLALMEKPGRVWSREQLMEKAWDSPEASLERTVDAHVKSLRAKLRAADPRAEPIRTHRGLGYSLAEDW